MDSTYSGSYGRVKVIQSDFLTNSFINSLLEMKDVDEITHALSSTSYREDIDALYSLYRNPELVDMAINRHLIKKNKLALFAPPPMSRNVLTAYMSKWDVENIKAILSSKVLGYSIKETETFLVSFRDLPMGIFGGNLSHEDYKSLMARDSVESIVNYLSRFGYGSYLLQYMDFYRKNGEISRLLSALDSFFYIRLMDSLKFYNGDEGPLVRFFREEIDSKNIMILLKAKDLDVSYDRITGRMIPMGNLSLENLEELFGAADVDEIVTKLRGRYDFDKGLSEYKETGGLNTFEIDMKRAIYKKYLENLSSQSLSVGSILAMVFRAEIERENLHTIVIGKSYSLDNDKIADLLIRG